MSAGVKYFPLDVCIDSKLEGIENEFGIKGFAVIVKLFQRIYGQEGYYCEWNDEVLLSFSTRVCLMGGSSVSEIVESAIQRGIFDAGLYKQYGILTSKGIQKRYLEITARRKNANINPTYLLIPCTSTTEDVYNSEENVYISDENADIFSNKEIKEEKELKEVNKKNKINETATSVFKFYEDNIGSINSIIAQKLSSWVEDVDVSLIEYAIEQAVKSNAKNLNYIEAVLNNHLNAGRKTRADAENHKPKKKTGNKFLNFEQPSVDTVSIEEMLAKKRKGIV